ncbi:DNA methyltransferase [Anaeromyxobacter sp. Red801]|uniref:DNA methyltransferase n=1 Tax=Anaeromyxobacter sp. Red801 TaxID=3411632 RepID=UPI003BA2FD33
MTTAHNQATPNPLQEFVGWVKANLRGDEKSEAQLFLERLFQAFGHKGVAEAGAHFEERVKGTVKGKKKKSTTFADLVWKPRVVIEMKAGGVKLERHYEQVFHYWAHLVPNRPRWAVLCNFDEFWIYDFERMVEEPMDIVSLAELPQRSAALAFLRPEYDEPVFELNRLAVTQAAADSLAQVFNSLVKRRVPQESAQRLVLQSLVALFAEDLRLLPPELFTRVLQESVESKSPSERAFQLMGELFTQMNSRIPAPSGRFQKVQYFNGGLFARVEPIKLTSAELHALREASLQDWSKVSPAIFGSIFQASLGKAQRHAYGAHFTSESDILKVVLPTVVAPWRERLAAAKTLEALVALRKDLLKYQVLDPACGSGNFLYVAYRELKRVETDLVTRIHQEFSGKRAKSIGAGHLSVKQFHGFDVLPFAVELAKVTLLLAKELAIVETQEALGDAQGLLEIDPALPLENLDGNVRCDDALFAKWPSVDAVIGNPPYQSKNKAQREFGRKYLNRVRAAFPDVPGRADYCVYFFRKAHDQLRAGCRAGLVGTNTIRENESREGGLDYILRNGGTITEAVSTQAWSGDAAVHVSIVNWVKGDARGRKKLWAQAENGEWTITELDEINSALKDRIDVASADTLKACAKDGLCAQGQTQGHDGFLMPAPEARELLKGKPAFRAVLYPFLIGDDLLDSGQPTRYVIDFHGLSIFEAQKYASLFQRVKREVLPDREEAKAKEDARNAEALRDNPGARVNRHHANFLSKWWVLSYARAELVNVLAALPRYVACSRVTKRPIFEFVETAIRPSDALQVFPFDDDYTFGILQSGIHWQWFTARCSTLEERFRYTSDTVFDSFPWPQHPSLAHVKAVASAGVALREVRRKLMKSGGYGLRRLYQLAEQPGRNDLKDAQERLDAAVMGAYGFSTKKPVLGSLLALNHELAKREAQGRAIVGPGLPPDVKDRSVFVSGDCLRVD